MPALSLMVIFQSLFWAVRLPTPAAGYGVGGGGGGGARPAQATAIECARLGCGFSTSARSGMAAHARVHTGERATCWGLRMHLLTV